LVNAHIAALVKQLCSQKKLSVTNLLKEGGISKSFIYDLEKRDRTPSAEVLLKLAEALDVSTDYLLGRTDNPDINK